jgi:hypothetical protein
LGVDIQRESAVDQDKGGTAAASSTALDQQQLAVDIRQLSAVDQGKSAGGHGKDATTGSGTGSGQAGTAGSAAATGASVTAAPTLDQQSLGVDIRQLTSVDQGKGGAGAGGSAATGTQPLASTSIAGNGLASTAIGGAGLGAAAGGAPTSALSSTSGQAKGAGRDEGTDSFDAAVHAALTAAPAPTTTTNPANATAPAQTTVAVPDPQPALTAALGRLRVGADGTQQLSVQLHPADLGSVNVTATITGGTLSVTLACNDAAARAAVAAALPALHHQLGTAGFTGVDVQFGGPSQQTPQQAQQQQQGAQQQPGGSGYAQGPGSSSGTAGRAGTPARADTTPGPHHLSGNANLDRWL